MLEVKPDSSFLVKSAQLKALHDKELLKSWRKELRTIGRDLGKTVLREGAQELPRRGGLAKRVASGKVGVRINPGVSVSILLSNGKGDDYPGAEDGTLVHPTFGRAPWVTQNIGRSGMFHRAFVGHKFEAVNAMSRATDEALRSMAG